MKGPWPPGVVQNVCVSPSQALAEVSEEDVAFRFVVSDPQRVTGGPQAPVTVTQ